MLFLSTTACVGSLYLSDSPGLKCCPFFIMSIPLSNAAINGHLELPLLKEPSKIHAISMLNLEVYKFRDWWILTYFIFGHGGSSPNNIWSMVNLERNSVLFFYYFLCLRVNLDLEKTNQLGESSPNFIFTVVNPDPIILEMRWINGESWPNDFVEKVNRGEDLRWVGSRCPACISESHEWTTCTLQKKSHPVPLILGKYSVKHLPDGNSAVHARDLQGFMWWWCNQWFGLLLLWPMRAVIRRGSQILLQLSVAGPTNWPQPKVIKQ